MSDEETESSADADELAASSERAVDTDSTHDDSDDKVNADIHDFRELLRTQDYEGLVSALENPDLLRLACDDARYLKIAMQGIGVLAWDEPALASELLVRFDTDRSRENPDSEARRAARSLMAALEWRQFESQDELSVPMMTELRTFLRLFPALNQEPEHGALLRADMQDRPAFYSDFLEALSERAQVLPDWIYQLERQAWPRASDPDNELQALNEAQLGALSTTVSELRAALKSRARQYPVIALVIGLIVVLPNAAGVLLALLTVGAAFALGESKSYSKIVRPRLVKLAVEHGVGAKHVVSWLYRLSGKAGRVGNFDIKIENDRALDLLAALSRSASPSG